MFVDCHCHIFTKRIVENVRSRTVMVEELKLNVAGALKRTEPQRLEKSAEDNHMDVCLLLPTAQPEKVREENDLFAGLVNGFNRIRSLATLHPMMRDLCGEIERMYDLGVRGFKFSSFSQRFNVMSDEVELMLAHIERLGQSRGFAPALVFDTFTQADTYFGAQPEFLTLPAMLGKLASRRLGINFVGAHMGGLLYDFDGLRRELLPGPNLYLDTSNAAHTLTEDQFIELLKIHGASQILFGTDWPWFDHASELTKITGLMTRAAYTDAERAAALGGNARRLFGF
jgi:predicted TIM-barrel fold metal-dependent hydrolase